MKDNQAKNDATLSGVPLLSPLLHCIAIPIVVFLRFNFGYAYLGPKFIFLPVIFTGSAASLLAWQFSSLQDNVRGLIGFHIAASALYLVHLAIAHGSIWARSSEHCQFSGSSYLLALSPAKSRNDFEPWAHRVIEPLIVGVGAALIGESLGAFLMIAAISLLMKEWINAWYTLRQQKAAEDAIIDAETRMDPHRNEERKPITGAGRTDEADRPRSSGN